MSAAFNSEGFSLRVDPGVLRRKSDVLNRQITTVRNLFENMKSRVASSAHYWQGEAGDAHRQAYNAPQATIEEMIKRLSEHVVDLQKIAGIYDGGEGEVTDISTPLNDTPMG